VLVNRGYYDADAVERFSTATLMLLYDPFLVGGMARACERLIDAIERGERIVIHGDYDVDGLSATALLMYVLRDLNARVTAYIPQRTERGYGLHPETVQELADAGAQVIVTVDCGINAMDAARVAQRLGVDLIITDHHEPHVAEEVDEYDLVVQTSLFDYAVANGGDKRIASYNVVTPPACAVLNPKIGHYPFSDLAGVGVAFKLAHGLVKMARQRHVARADDLDLRHHLDLVALGTIADAVPLRDENRILAKHGLACLAHTRKPGLQKLLAITKFQRISVETIVFGLAPRLNAAGRLGDARAALNLLLTHNSAEAEEIAHELDLINKERQKVERETLRQARELFEQNLDVELPAGSKVPGGLLKYAPEAPRVIVLAHDEWNPGVIGIVASRMVERYYMPCVIVALQGESGRGSCRSIRDFHMVEALRQCGHLLMSYGGHRVAAGISIARENIDALRDELDRVARASLSAEEYVPILNIDAACALGDITLEFCSLLEQFKPFGQGNPRPCFLVRDVKLTDEPTVLKDKHVRLSFMHEGTFRSVIAYNWIERLDDLKMWPQMDIVVYPTLSYFRGEARVDLELVDARGVVP
jgi:single-stranded-DNA-specific exonuclease